MTSELEKIEAAHRVASMLREAGKALTQLDREGAIALLELAYKYEMQAVDMAATNPVTAYDKQRFFIEATEIRQEIEAMRSIDA